MVGLLLEDDARIETVKILVTEAREQHRLDVQRRLHRLTQALVGHHALLRVQHRRDPAVRLHDDRLDTRRGLDPVVLIGLDLLDVLVLARRDARLPRRVVGDRQEEQLVHVRDPLAGEAARRLTARRVAVEARELDVAIGAVLDELEGTGADVLLQRRVARLLDHLLGIDGGRTVHMGEDREQRARGLLQPDLHGERVLRLDGFHVLEDGLARARDRAPALERGHDVGGAQRLAVVEPDVAAELNREALTAVGDIGALGQQRRGLILRVQREEPFVHVDDDLARDHGGGRVRVERRRLADERHAQHSAFCRGRRFGRRLRLAGRRGPDRDGEQHHDHERPRDTVHVDASCGARTIPRTAPGRKR